MRSMLSSLLVMVLMTAEIAAQVTGTTTVGGPFVSASVPIGSQPIRASLLSEDAFPTRDDALDLLYGNLKIDVGFEYLQPVRSGGNANLVIPFAAASAFPSAGMGNFDHDFAFIPKFGIEYHFADLGFGTAASGKLFNLQGNAQRTVGSAAGTSVFTVDDSVNVAVANFLEGVFRFDFLDTPADCFIHELKLQATFGARYSYVSQNLTASLASGSNLISQTATQTFTGFGITGSLGGIYPLGDQGISLYGFSRGSLLAGNNNRTSKYSVIVTDIAGANLADQLTDQRTILIPVGEFEAGVSWVRPMTRSAQAEFKPLGWIRAGLATQLWGDLGLLDTPSVQIVRTHNPLILYGFSISAGFSM